MRTLILLLPILLTGCAHHAATPSPVTQPAPSEPARPVAALWYAVGYPPVGYTGPMDALIVAVWSDGRIVWSSNRKTGGAPYLTASVSPDRVQQLLADLKSAGFFEETYENYYPPDASHTVLAADSGPQRKRLATWMDLVRPGANNYEPRPHEKHFREVWTPSRAAIEAIIPAHGEPTDAPDSQIFKLGRAKKN